MRIIDANTELSSWNSFVESTEAATACHQFGWNTVIAKSFGHRCYYLAVMDDQGQWQGILPLVHMRSRIFGNFLVSVPFVNYGGLLCNTDTAAALLLEKAAQLRRSCDATHVELRHASHYIAHLPTRQHKVSMVLNLARDADTQWKAFNPKLRNQIRKAEKSGLQFIMDHLDLLDDFYEVFARNMRDLGTPVYEKKFFYNVLDTFTDTSKIFAVRHQGKVICAGIALWFRDTIEMPWASSISDYRALCPNNMLYWEAIRFAIKCGFRKFDFGRSTPHEGTYNFKKQWGALPMQLHWQYLMDKGSKMPELNPSNPKYQTAIRVWQRLPVLLTKVLGPFIVRNIP